MTNMNEINEIIKTFVKKELKAKLLFINGCEFGCEFSDGSFAHLSIDYIVEYFKNKENK